MMTTARRPRRFALRSGGPWPVVLLASLAVLGCAKGSGGESEAADSVTVTGFEGPLVAPTPPPADGGAGVSIGAAASSPAAQEDE